MYVIQEEKKIVGEGEKWKYKGELLPYSEHDPIQITGTIINDTVYCKYSLNGSKRETIGNFKGYYKDDKLIGTFSGTAANAKGSFSAKRVN